MAEWGRPGIYAYGLRRPATVPFGVLPFGFSGTVTSFLGEAPPGDAGVPHLRRKTRNGVPAPVGVSRPDQRNVTQLNAMNPEFVGVDAQGLAARPTSSTRKEVGMATRPR